MGSESDESATAFWAFHRPAGELVPGAMIFDPVQLDLAGDPVVLVGHVSPPDRDGMVTITGHHESGQPYSESVAGDWPVELDRGQRADFALLVDLERLLLDDEL